MAFVLRAKLQLLVAGVVVLVDVLVVSAIIPMSRPFEPETNMARA